MFGNFTWTWIPITGNDVYDIGFNVVAVSGFAGYVVGEFLQLIKDLIR